MRGNTIQNIDRRLVQTCRLFYEQRLSKSEIARRQQLSVTHVNRLLLEGQRLGLVEIRVVGPRLKSIELELLSKYDLKEVRVVSSANDPSATIVELGRQGAALFEEIVAPGNRVGLSSGRTIFEFVSRVHEMPRDIAVFPLNVVYENETRVTGVSANTSATILWFRSRPSATAHRVELFIPDGVMVPARELVGQIQRNPTIQEMRKGLEDLDMYFLGAGEPGLESRFWALQTLHESDPGSRYNSLPVGDVAFNVLDEDGNNGPTDIEELVFHVDRETLRRAAECSDKSVVLMAGGMKKSKVIKAALEARLCNVLITDSDVAEHLLGAGNTGNYPAGS